MHKLDLRLKTFVFLLCAEVQKTLSFPFSLLRYYEMPANASVLISRLTTAGFELVQQLHHATEIGM